MTYIYRVLREGPSGLWPMDSQPIVDKSGYGKNATFTGTPRTTRPIVARGIAAQLLDSGDIISYPIGNIMKSGRENSSFTLEAWVKPSDGNTEILTRDNSGLFIDGLKLRFSIDMGTVYSVEYKNLRAGDIYHVVAVYDGTGIYLFLNGVRVAGLDIDVPAAIADTATNLSSSTSSSVVLDSVATYSYVLPASVIAAHYVLGTDYPGVTDLSKNNGGNHYDFVDTSVGLYAKGVFPDTLAWTAGLSEGLAIINNQLVNLYSDIDLQFEAGTWTYQESFEADALTTIVGSRIIWRAGDDVVVEKSEDGGTTWNALSNGGQIVSNKPLTSGYSVSIRVSIPASVEQIAVEYLSVAFYSSLNVVGADEDLPAVILNPAATTVAEYHRPAASFNDNAGIIFADGTGGLSIAEDDVFGGYFAVEMTVKVDSSAASATVLYVNTASAQPQITTNSSGNWTFANLTALYVDGVSISSGATVTAGEWHHVLAVFPESLATVYVGNNAAGTAGYPMRIGHLATYSDDVSASDAATIYKAWVGAPASSVAGGAASIGENSPTAPRGLMGVTADSQVQSNSAYPKTMLTTNPAVYWQFNESSGTTVFDSSGYGRNGVCMYGAQLGGVGLTPCGPSGAAYFSGTGSPEIIMYGSDAPASNSFSASCIVKTTSSALMFTWNRMSSIAAAHGYYCGINNGYPAFKIYGSATERLASVQVNDGKPHHIVWVHTQGSNPKIYVDGVLVLTAPAETVKDASQQPGLKLGANDAGVGGSFPFDGTIDEAAWWGRALTAAEVTTLHEGSVTCRRPSFTGYSHDWAIVTGG
ncbi:hypothetical protein SEA_BILLNYE_18 [Streptomyces phage BillNye]|uniref:LamG-like jellyroll fold domain-containing protein n=1 Tax=Streptomyces phage BillNye TaxID=2079426 RepID=A0A2L1IVJ6_9CAUD|nr:hypothetical protein FDJ30_gp213 [Streptomyces phage BillNye]AVD99220.1 hypothetical protein SEA_BILLNYE_18 [Streptomyces phage BillNye]